MLMWEIKKSWKWTNTGEFIVKSFYQFLNFGGIKSPWAHIWQISAPLKVKVTVWLALKNRLNTIDLLFLCVFCVADRMSQSNIFSWVVALLNQFGCL